MLKSIATTFLLIFLLSTPFLISAQESGIVPCDGVSVKCDFSKLVELANNVINFLILFSIPLTVISFMYAGFLYLTAGGSEGQVKKARDIFWKVLWGFIFILSAWLIVQTIINAFLKPSFSFLGN